MNDQKMFAWCFSHGVMHHFAGDPWCTAQWVPLCGVTETEAMGFKERTYGGARFLHQLSNDQQIKIILPESP